MKERLIGGTLDQATLEFAKEWPDFDGKSSILKRADDSGNDSPRTIITKAGKMLFRLDLAVFLTNYRFLKNRNQGSAFCKGTDAESHFEKILREKRAALRQP